MEKAIIKYNNPEKEDEDFYEKFINCLKSGEKFEIYDAVVEGDIDIEEIYERIKNIKDKELKGAKLEKKDYKIIIKININVYMVKVEFKGEFKMYFSKNTEKIVICTIFGGDAFFTNSTFKKGANFDYTIFKKDAIFWFSKFGDKNTIKFRHSIFEGVAQFNNSEVGFKIYFMNVIFKEKANFKKALLNRAHFNNCIFEKEAYFIDTEFNGKVKFEKLTFESIAKFTDISFDSLSLREAIFNDIVLFKKKKENKNIGIAIFNLVNFKEPENTTFIDFPLSKTSFLLTDVKEITIIAKAEKILSEYLLDYLDKKNNEEIKEDNKDELYEKALEILKPYLRQETVLKEYRDMRKSFENNRTYVEASELFIYEMDLIRRITTFDERKFIEKIKPALEYGLWGIYFYLPYLVLFEFWICLKTESYLIFLITIIIVLYAMWKGRVITSLTFWIYKLTSNYGESITKPIFISFFIILVFPYIIDFLNWIWFFVSNFPLLNELLNKNGSAYEQILRAFFQLGIDKDVINSTTNPIQKEQLKTLASYEWLIRIISLILIGNILIAIKRRLERK